MSRWLIAACAGALTLVSAGFGADSSKTIGHVPGTFSAVAVSGDFAYLGGFFLTVVETSDPLAPRIVGELLIGGGEGYLFDVAVSDGVAYATGIGPWFGGNLYVIDVSTPATPHWLSGLLVSGEARGIAVSDGYAYFLFFDDFSNPPACALQVIDMSDPSEPEILGSVAVEENARRVAVAEGYAYVAGGGLSVVDVSEPSEPELVSFVGGPPARDVAVSGEYAYVAELAGLRVFDVTRPVAPVEIGYLATSSANLDIAVSGDRAYLARRNPPPGGLRVIDVSVPSAPVEVRLYDANIGWPPAGVAVSGDYVYFAAGNAGLYVFREGTPGPLPDGRESFIPAAALAAGAQGAFFQTDVEINNTGWEEAQVRFKWLPRGENNSQPIASNVIALAPGQSRRYENVLTEVFGLGPDSLGALKLVASTGSVIGMSRTYNLPAGEVAGTFGQGLPAIRSTEMITGTEPQRIIFLSENDDSRANVGCVNGRDEDLTINIGLFDDEGTFLETKTMDLGPYSNNQINRIFQDYAPVNGHVDVWAGSDDALYFCYGSLLDNMTSDPTTILPQVPSDERTFIPAAALTAGLEGSFFQTDVDLNNAGSADLTYELLWLPRGGDNSDPVRSEEFSLAPGAGVRYANVLDEVFGLEPDQVGALAVEASGTDLLAMSRTYDLPSAKVAGTFGQELPGIPADRMIPTGIQKRIIFMNVNDDVRSNVGCHNAGLDPVTVMIELHDSDGAWLGTKTMELPPLSNDQITRVFRNHAPVSAGYVDVWTDTEGASIYCYGSVLDNQTNDPTTVLPQ